MRYSMLWSSEFCLSTSFNNSCCNHIKWNKWIYSCCHVSERFRKFSSFWRCCMTISMIGRCMSTNSSDNDTCFLDYSDACACSGDVCCIHQNLKYAQSSSYPSTSETQTTTTTHFYTVDDFFFWFVPMWYFFIWMNSKTSKSLRSVLVDTYPLIKEPLFLALNLSNDWPWAYYQMKYLFFSCRFTINVGNRTAFNWWRRGNTYSWCFCAIIHWKLFKQLLKRSFLDLENEGIIWAIKYTLL